MTHTPTHILLAVAFSGLLVAAPAKSENVPIQSMVIESATPEALGPIEVILTDRSRDSCWTNLRDVREYAEEKLLADGFEIAPQDSRSFNLNVVVSAFRQEAIFGQGRCAGLISFRLVAGITPPAELGIPPGNLVVASYTAGIPSARTLNDEVIHFLGHFFDGLAEARE